MGRKFDEESAMNCVWEECTDWLQVDNDTGLQTRIEEALVLLDRTAVKVSRTSQVGQLVEQIGCRLTGRKGSWHPGDR